MKDVRNRTLEEIAAMLKDTPRPELFKLIHSLATLEPHFSIADVALRRGLKKHTVRRLIEQRKIAPAHVPTDRGDYRIPLSAVQDWDRRTALTG